MRHSLAPYLQRQCHPSSYCTRSPEVALQAGTAVACSRRCDQAAERPFGQDGQGNAMDSDREGRVCRQGDHSRLSLGAGASLARPSTAMLLVLQALMTRRGCPLHLLTFYKLLPVAPDE